MASPLPPNALVGSVSRPKAQQARSKASILAGLADAIGTRWDAMDHQERVQLARRIQVLSLELGRLADGISKPSALIMSDQGGSPWFGGFIFLTPREYDVLQALSVGVSTRRIGDLFGIRPTTVRSHVKGILTKLNVHSRVEAVSLLLEWRTRGKQPS